MPVDAIDQDQPPVSAAVVPATDSPTLHGFIADRVKADATIYTDEHRVYKGLANRASGCGKTGPSWSHALSYPRNKKTSRMPTIATWTSIDSIDGRCPVRMVLAVFGAWQRWAGRTEIPAKVRFRLPVH